jgi:hypothetical protein
MVNRFRSKDGSIVTLFSSCVSDRQKTDERLSGTHLTLSIALNEQVMHSIEMS